MTPSYEEMGYWLSCNTDENDYIYILGSDPRFIASLSLSGRVSSSKYFHAIFLTGDKERNILYSDLIEKPPVFVLKEENDSINIKELYGKKIDSLLNNNYLFFLKKEGFEIYRLNKSF